MISKCMEKKPHKRWQHMLDVKLLLEDLRKDLDLPPAEMRESRGDSLAFIRAMGVVAGAVLATVAYSNLPRSRRPAQPNRFTGC